MQDTNDLELKGLKLELIDLVSELTNAEGNYIPFTQEFEPEIKALIGLSRHIQRERLRSIAYKVICPYIENTEDK